MNTINPQSVPQGAQRDARGGERTEANSIPVDQKGKTLPIAEAKQTEAADNVRKQNQGEDQLADAVAKLNDYIQTVQRDLRFSLDEGSGEAVITVVDRESNEVIRRIPEEVTLTLAQKLNNEEPLLLFSARV